MTSVLSSAALEGVEAVSFDLDGTLYELPAMKRAVRRLALRRALSPLRTASELRRLFRALGTYQAARRAGGDLRGLALEEPAALRALEARWWIPAIAAAGPRPGVSALLEALRARGLPLVVCSDHPGEAKLEALGLSRLFAAVHAADVLGALKPSPCVLEAAAAGLGIAVERILHVGDRDDSDGAAARAAGARCWLVPSQGAVALESA